MAILGNYILSIAKLSPSWQVHFELGLSLALISVITTHPRVLYGFVWFGMVWYGLL